MDGYAIQVPTKENEERDNAPEVFRYQIRQPTYGQKHPPFFIILISIAQIVTFAFYTFRSDEPITAIGPVPYNSRLIYNPYRRYEVWRFLSYMLVHAGYYHITFNVLIQLLVGIPLETLHRFNPVFIIYLGGIVGGALGNSIADPSAYLAGSSSGCYALISAHLADVVMNWQEMKCRWVKMLALLAFSLSDITIGLYERHHRPYRNDHRVSYAGHLAGAASGLLLGLIFLRNLKRHRWEETTARWATAIFVLLIVSYYN